MLTALDNCLHFIKPHKHDIANEQTQAQARFLLIVLSGRESLTFSGRDNNTSQFSSQQTLVLIYQSLGIEIRVKQK